MQQLAKNLLDKIGIAVTSLCAVHCILLPVLIPVLPLVGLGFVAGEAFEHTILALTMILGVVALYSGYQRYHRTLYPFISLFTGGIVYLNRYTFGDDLEPIMTVISAMFIVGAHIANMRLCNMNSNCDNCGESHGHA